MKKYKFAWRVDAIIPVEVEAESQEEAEQLARDADIDESKATFEWDTAELEAE